MKTSPCSGRTDWVSVAKENPTGGGNVFEVFPTSHRWTTFGAAMAEANSLRTSPLFSRYCCREYSVWQNDQTRKFSVVVGKFGNAGMGWHLVKGDLCCEEAFAQAGLPNAASCGAGGHTTGCGAGYKWDEQEAGWTSVWVRRGNSNVFDATYTGPTGQKARTVNSVTVEGIRIAIRRTASSDKNLCSYTGTIASDGVTIQGTYTCAGRTRPWNGRISCVNATPAKPPANGDDPDQRPLCERLPQGIRAQFAPPVGGLKVSNDPNFGGPVCQGDSNHDTANYLYFTVERPTKRTAREAVDLDKQIFPGGAPVAGVGDQSYEVDVIVTGEDWMVFFSRGLYYVSVKGSPANKNRVRQLAQQLDAAIKTWNPSR